MLVPEEALKTVVFIGTKKGGKFHSKATGFIVNHSQFGLNFKYLVTAQHVIVGIMMRGYDVCVRFNMKDKTTQDLNISSSEWIYHPDDGNTIHDVAVLPFWSNEADLLATPLDGDPIGLGTLENLKAKQIGVGDEVAVIGLFRPHPGRALNAPIVRIGHVAALGGEPVKTTIGNMHSHLIQLHSRAGLSGSPAFISLPAYRNVAGRSVLTVGNQFYLLGLVHGHWDERLSNDEEFEGLREENSNDSNTGIAVICPVERIIETINQPFLTEKRRLSAENYLQNRNSR